MEPVFVNEYEITFEMYQEWGKHPVGEAAVKNQKKGITLRIALICISVFLIIDALILREYLFILPAIIFLVIALNRLFFLPGRVLKKQYDLILKAQNRSRWLRKITVSDSIFSEDGNMITQYEFSDILKMTEDDYYFYLFTCADLVLRIYKGGFTTGKADAFREYIDANVLNHTKIGG